MYNINNINDVKKIINNSKFSVEKNYWNNRQILESLGYKYNQYSRTIDYIYEKNIKLYRCNKPFESLKIDNFEFLDDFKKYNSLIKCEDKNKLIIKEFKENIKKIEDNPSTYDNIDKQFKKCYKSFDINKIQNRCEIYDGHLTDKIKKYIKEESKNLDQDLMKKIKNEYKIKKKFNYNFDNCDLIYTIDEDSIK